MQGVLYIAEKFMFHPCSWVQDEDMIERTWPWCAWKNKYKVLKKNKVQNLKLCSLCSCPFSWNYFSPQWYRTHTAQWDTQSIFRSPSSLGEGERTKKFLSTFHHWFWSPAKAFHLQKSNSHISAAPADNEDNCFIHFVKAEMKRGQSKMMPS